jgi:hypothetical protein
MTTIAGLLALSMLSTGDDPILDRQFAHVKNNTNANISIDDIQSVAQAAKTVQGTKLESTIAQGFHAKPDSSVAAPAAFAPDAPAQNRALRYAPLRGLKDIKGMSKSVSVNFENKTASDILKWMSKQGVNFAVNVDSLPKNRISMHMTNAPLHDVLSAVADVLGGQWSLRNNTLIFNQGHSFRAFAPGFEFQPFAPIEVPVNGSGLKPLGKHMVEHEVVKGLHEKALRRFGEEMPKVLGEVERVRAAEMPRIREEIERVRAIDTPKAREAKRIEVKNFMNSITKEQKELMKTRGYLKISDLTEAQKALINYDPKSTGKFEMQISVDNEKIVIKDQ